MEIILEGFPTGELTIYNKSRSQMNSMDSINANRHHGSRKCLFVFCLKEQFRD